MRNFWVDCKIDGRKTDLCGGPRSKDGGMEIEVRQRDDGRSVVVCKIQCEYDSSTDEVVTYVKNGDGNVIKEKRTKR